MFGSVRVIIMAVLFFGIAGAGVYVMKLRSDNAILKANQVLLEQSVESQKQVIQKQQQDFSQILESNKKMNTLINNLQKDIDALDKRFNKGARDFGKLAMEKYGLGINNVLESFKKYNNLISAGKITNNNSDYSVKIKSLYKSAAELNRLPIKSSSNKTIYLSDIASVKQTFDKNKDYVNINGNPGILLQINL